MSESLPGGVEPQGGIGVAPRIQRQVDSRRARLLKLLRTRAGRQQALLLADILSPPVAARRRRAPISLK